MNIQKLYPDAYPFLLKQMTRSPKSLDYIGTIPSDNYKFLCVVGSRKESTYGQEVCRKLITGLRGYPVVIVSGLAIGIDSIAHEAALEAGLKTIAFPGSGLDPSVLYPFSRQDLARRIVEAGGALISKFPETFSSDVWTFQVRNELMAAMSHATLIIEGRQGSGALGTTDYAEKLNRDVLAVPGSIYSELSYGPHMLIRRGAAVITSSHDILQELGFDTHPETRRLAIDLDTLDLSPDEKKICSYLLTEHLTSSSLIERTSLPPISLSIALSSLEMKNIVSESGGMYRMTSI